jgi:hypothetical protein
MKLFKKRKKLLILSLLFIFTASSLAVLINIKQRAGAAPYDATDPTNVQGHNVSGYAWSSNFGWISFNDFNGTDSQWTSRRLIEINSGQITGTLNEFPVLVKLSNDNSIKTTSMNVDASGVPTDVIFTDIDGKNIYKHQIEYFNKTNGDFIAWVRIPTAKDGERFYMYYGNPKANIDISTFEVWDNDYVGVWHGEGKFDDTKHRNDFEVNMPANIVAGKIGSALSFDAVLSDDYAESLNDNLNDVVDAITFEAWAKKPNSSGGQLIGQKNDDPLNSDTENYYLGYLDNDFIWMVKNSSGVYSPSLNSPANNDTWHHVVGVYSSALSELKLYVDGVEKAVANTHSGNFANSGNGGLTLGAGWDIDSLTDKLTGQLDEIRISKVARTSEWIAASYNSQNSPNSFLNMGAVESGSFSPIKYGVNVDIYGAGTKGNFSGQAWSPYVGWISFDVPPPETSFRANCPQYNCRDNNNCTACLDFATGRIYGWAKALVLDGDGWIRFDHNGAEKWPDNTMSAYVDSSPPSTPYAFRGWAWNGDVGNIYKGIGWMCFNSADTNCGGGGVFSTKIEDWNNKPSISGIPQAVHGEYCIDPTLRVFLSWIFNDPNDTQKAYNIEVKRISDNHLFNYSGGFSNTHTFTDIQYGEKYEWKVRVQDDTGQWSAWVDGQDFEAPKHKYPEVEIASWFPEDPSEGEEVNFYASTTTYKDDHTPVTGNTCYGDLTNGGCKFLWSIDAGGAGEIAVQDGVSTETSLVPIVVFKNRAISTTVRLTVTDNDNYSCDAAKTFDPGSIKVKLPVWVEQK